jgi:uncharacterized protein (TIGR02757 family)
MLQKEELFNFLEEKYLQYNNPKFIESDPVSIPHRFTRKEDIEIAGFMAATIAWGQRVSIIKNASRMMSLMDDSPYDFIINAELGDYCRFEKFVHRTYNSEDCGYFLRSLQNIYKKHNGLESVFSEKINEGFGIKEAIIHFRNIFIELKPEIRTLRHISDPEKNSAAKRINMFLRWMVRKDNAGVDFGIWNSINASELFCPLDVHSGNVGRKLGLLTRNQNDWKAVAELTGNLKSYDAKDPVKYDFALFGLGVFEKF